MRLVKRERALAAFFVFLLGEYSVVLFLFNHLVQGFGVVPRRSFFRNWSVEDSTNAACYPRVCSLFAKRQVTYSSR